MIDNPDQVERLITRLTAVLPVPARITAELAATLQTEKLQATARIICSLRARVREPRKMPRKAPF